MGEEQEDPARPPPARIFQGSSSLTENLEQATPPLNIACLRIPAAMQVTDTTGFDYLDNGITMINKH